MILRTIPIASVDLVHFWPLKVDDEQPNNNQLVVEDDGEVERNVDSSWLATSEGEMGLVQCLTTWCPWKVPTPELVENMQIAFGNCRDLPLSSRARQLALSELAREDALYAEPWPFSVVISMRGRLPVSVSVRLAVLIPKDMPAQKKYQRAEMMLKAAPEFFRANMRQRNRVAKAVKCEVFANMDSIQRVIEKDCQLKSI